MRPMIRAAALSLALALAAASGTARAQYVYPGGYGGWGGWGGPATVGGNHAAGMGMFAAGAGAYNEQTAEARAINAQTAMQANEYLYQSQQRRNATYQKRLAQEKQLNIETAQTNFNRINSNPNENDIHQGDAPNAVFDQLKNPKVFDTAVREATQAIPSALVKNLVLQYAPQAVAISLEDLSARGVPDTLLTAPAFESDRKAIRALIADARKQSEDNDGRIDPETLAKLRVALKGLLRKVGRTIPAGTPDRRDCDNFIKALYGLTKMLETPNIAAFLRGLDKIETTTLGHLLVFMHSFDLRFGAAQTPEQERAYDQLYPLLANLRDMTIPANTPPPQYGQEPPPSDPKKLTQFFSGMAYSHFEPQPGQAPPPPAPGR